MSAATRPTVLTLRVHPGQVRFSGEMPELIEDAEADPRSVPMLVRVGEEVVGYFRLDFTPGAVAALVDWLREHHPEVRRLALSVNRRNPAARRAYEKAGFRVEGDPYLGGSAGPQDVMVLDLKGAEVQGRD